MSTWPRLSDTLPYRSPSHCNACGRGSPDAPFLANGGDLRLWQECDQNDRPEARYVLLCKACADRLIEPHPRLYRRIHHFAPAPGAMRLCGDCAHRDGTICRSPKARFNGGEGTFMVGPKPTRVHILRAPSRLSVWETWYNGPIKHCDGKETKSDTEDT